MAMPALTSPTVVETWATHYATEAGRRYWPCEELVRFAGRRGAFLGDRVLEVGCGNGANLWFLAEKVGTTVGVDLHLGALREATAYAAARGCGQETRDSRPGRRTRAGDVVVAQGEIGRLPFVDGVFDGVADLMVSQHAPWDAHRALYGEYRRVVRRGGWGFLYHLTARTTGRGTGGPDTDRLALFPEAGFTCLPEPGSLVFALETEGWRVDGLRGLSREYPDGAVAHYAVVDATAV